MREIIIDVKPGDGIAERLVPKYIRDVWAPAYTNAMASQDRTILELRNEKTVVPILVKTATGVERRAHMDADSISLEHPDSPDHAVKIPFTVDRMANMPHSTDEETLPSSGSIDVNTKGKMEMIVEEFPWIRSCTFTPLWRTVASLNLTHLHVTGFGSQDQPIDSMASTPDRVLGGGEFRIVVDDDTVFTRVNHSENTIDADATDTVDVQFGSDYMYGPMDLNFRSNHGRVSTKVSEVIDGSYPVLTAPRLTMFPDHQNWNHRFVMNGYLGRAGYGNFARGHTQGSAALGSTSWETDDSGNSYVPNGGLYTVNETPGTEGGELNRYWTSAPEDASSSTWLSQLLPLRFVNRVRIQQKQAVDAPYDTDAFTAGVTFALGSIGG